MKRSAIALALVGAAHCSSSAAVPPGAELDACAYDNGAPNGTYVCNALRVGEASRKRAQEERDARNAEIHERQQAESAARRTAKEEAEAVRAKRMEMELARDGHVPVLGAMQEPSNSHTARELATKCRAYDPICYDYLTRMRVWMWAHPEKTGKLCDDGHEWTLSNGTKSHITPIEIVAQFFLGRTNNDWYKTASAHDAAIWTIQVMGQCTFGSHIATPGEPDFPSAPQR